MDDPELAYYQAREAKARQQAAVATNPEIRVIHLRLAEGYGKKVQMLTRPHHVLRAV